ncbi:DUF6690 family protein [Candidatus Laterigemmans baculatus]|uniref:DUF6690 family protein n=1 Tax=Candidatus Laterigemmans baculatus TaxID=2770505 RepID=UPI0013D9DDE9|nr:DUF6690 family protein [Candidatus Laterigemmans baculatus]
MMRRMAAAGIIATAVGGPYVVTETEVGRSLSGQVRSVVGSASDGTLLASTEENAHQTTEKLWDRRIGSRDLDKFAESGTQRIAGGPVADFRDVLRFDISPNWVAEHFSRVTTVLSDLRLEGLRVPIVTGTQTDDVAGTVTYYFRPDHRLQRVCLHGFTGDPTRLVETMTNYYGMKPRPTLEAGVYTIDWNGGPTSVLKVSRAPILYADATRAQHTVFLELNQPDLEYGLSHEAAKIVGSDWSTGRW